jgi:hypothetical protein
LGEALLRRCRSEKVEPPAEGEVERVVNSAVRRHEDAFAAETLAKLGPGVCRRVTGLLDEDGLLAELRADPGPLGLDTLFAEIGKLGTVKALGLPDDLFAETSDRLVAAWRARAARMYPSDFKACAEPVQLTLLAALCWVRQTEITDGLVELLTGLIHRINARAERRVEKKLIGGLAPLQGKKASTPSWSMPRWTSPTRPCGMRSGRRCPSGGHPAQARAGVDGHRESLAGAGPGAVARLVHALLPQDARPAAGGFAVQVQQHGVPAGDGRHRASGPLQRRLR